MHDRPPVWTRLQRRLHWTVAALVLGQALLGWPMAAAVERLERLERVAATGATPGLLDFLVTTAHTGSGIAIGLLVAWRLKLRAERRSVAHGEVRRAWPARALQATLYASLVLMVVSGALHWYAGVAWAASWHGAGKWLLLGALVLHLGGALRHAVAGDGIFQSMSGRPGRR